MFLQGPLARITLPCLFVTLPDSTPFPLPIQRPLTVAGLKLHSGASPGAADVYGRRELLGEPAKNGTH